MLLVFHKRLKVSLKIYISIVVYKLMAVLFCIHVISSRLKLPSIMLLRVLCCDLHRLVAL